MKALRCMGLVIVTVLLVGQSARAWSASDQDAFIEGYNKTQRFQREMSEPQPSVESGKLGYRDPRTGQFAPLPGYGNSSAPPSAVIVPEDRDQASTFGDGAEINYFGYDINGEYHPALDQSRYEDQKPKNDHLGRHRSQPKGRG